MIAELQRRTRNLLAIVRSVAERTLGRGGSLDTFKNRLAALGRVPSLVGDALHEDINFAKIVRLELLAMGAPDNKVSVSGPLVSLEFEKSKRSCSSA